MLHTLLFGNSPLEPVASFFLLLAASTLESPFFCHRLSDTYGYALAVLAVDFSVVYVNSSLASNHQQIYMGRSGCDTSTLSYTQATDSVVTHFATSASALLHIQSASLFYRSNPRFYNSSFAVEYTKVGLRPTLQHVKCQNWTLVFTRSGSNTYS